jgi:hypothetical protein
VGKEREKKIYLWGHIHVRLFSICACSTVTSQCDTENYTLFYTLYPIFCIIIACKISFSWFNNL